MLRKLINLNELKSVNRSIGQSVNWQIQIKKEEIYNV
jgi:hypothetical protein